MPEPRTPTLEDIATVVGMARRFARVVTAAAEMRRLQRDYFQTRSAEVLFAAKAAEKRLDRLLAAPLGETSGETDVDLARAILSEARNG